ncbi:MAG: FmdB family zinc ribbon protein [Terriglobales bacterium]
MPIFEYICKDCNKPFEAIVIGSRKPECPTCYGHHLTQQISVFSVGGARSAPAASCGAAPST